jgi:hypothetical protein
MSGEDQIVHVVFMEEILDCHIEYRAIEVPSNNNLVPESEPVGEFPV